MRASRLFMLLIASLFTASADAAVVTYFSFNDYAAYVAGPPAGDPANFDVMDAGGAGSGSISIQDMGVDWPAADLGTGNGTTLNQFGGAGAGDAIDLTNADMHNGGQMIIAFSAAGVADPMLSLAIRAAQSSFTTVGLEYSNDGMNWSAAAFTINGMNTTDIPSPYRLMASNAGALTALAGDPTAYLRLTLSGAENGNSNGVLIDNIQINGEAVPEAQSLAMAAIALLLFAGIYWRRNASTTLSAPLNSATA